MAGTGDVSPGFQAACDYAAIRRAVIEELAREAEAGVPAGFVRTIRLSEADDEPVDTVAAWLRQHVEEEG